MIGMVWTSGHDKERLAFAAAMLEAAEKAEAFGLWIDGREAKVLLRYIANRVGGDMQKKAALSFPEFEASKRWVNGAEMEHLGYTVIEGEDIGGYCYADLFVIEDTSTWSEKRDPSTQRYYLLLGNSEYTNDNIAVLEQVLYRHYLNEVAE